MVFQQILGQRVRGDKVNNECHLLHFIQETRNEISDLFQTYYKVQWRGQLLHTWELEENLSPQKVEEFKGKTRPAGTARQSSSNDSVVGFERGLEPERILGR